MLDKNKSGEIEKKELGKALEAIGEHPSSKELNEMYQIIENLGTCHIYLCSIFVSITSVDSITTVC